jgi:hypothetical protein
MFDKSYEFRLCTKKKGNINDLFKNHYIFSFIGKNKERYLVYVEEYPFKLLGVKFFLKKHKLSPNKYKLLSGHQDVGGVVNTCIQIMLDFYRKDDEYSFGFIGVNLVNESGTSKRFRIYSLLMANKFSPVNFIHSTNLENNRDYEQKA